MRVILIVLMVTLFPACSSSLPSPEPLDSLVARGRNLFFNETFNGNGRTCGTCHPAENNFALSPSDIASLPDDDPLFVAEFIPELGSNFENPVLMRNLGLITENQDGFNDLANNFNLRGIPHTLGLRTSINSRTGPQTGWSGDGAPGDHSLRSFATGAVIQHFTLTTNRIAGVDFRLPTDEELDAMEAFQLSLGRQEELSLPLPLKDPKVLRGQELFNDISAGKCFGCHFNAGANGSDAIFGEGAGNLNFNTGVEDLPDQPGDMYGELNPPDDGLGAPGIGEFNTPSLVEAADTGPFFHNNSVETLEAAVEFYNGDTFNNSPAGQLVAGATGGPINLEATQVVAIAAFLRVVNALDNIKLSMNYLNNYIDQEFLGNFEYGKLIQQASFETEDAIKVLSEGGLHPFAKQQLVASLQNMESAMESNRFDEQTEFVRDALAALERARVDMTN